MRWKHGRRSRNVEDRRGRRVSKGAVGGGLGAILLGVIVVLMGGDPSQLLSALLSQGTKAATTTSGRGPTAAENEVAEFVSVVLADTEDVWNDLFGRMGRNYREPKLVLFTDAVESACGFQRSAVGPFYCPGDNQVYIDLSFFDDLRKRHGAPGDFAQAYVIAHEIGHHVQNLLGTSREVHDAQRSVGKTEANQLSVRLELQADFYAGVWAHHAQRARQVLEAGDIEEALTAAASIGDDRLQREAGGYVAPDSFTHGSSEQRVRWFRRGLETGDPDRGDTFSAREL